MDGAGPAVGADEQNVQIARRSAVLISIVQNNSVGAAGDGLLNSADPVPAHDYVERRIQALVNQRFVDSIAAQHDGPSRPVGDPPSDAVGDCCDGRDGDAKRPSQRLQSAQ